VALLCLPDSFIGICTSILSKFFLICINDRKVYLNLLIYLNYKVVAMLFFVFDYSSFSVARNDHHGLLVLISSPVSASICVRISLFLFMNPKSLNVFLTLAS